MPGSSAIGLARRAGIRTAHHTRRRAVSCGEPFRCTWRCRLAAPAARSADLTGHVAGYAHLATPLPERNRSIRRASLVTCHLPSLERSTEPAAQYLLIRWKAPQIGRLPARHSPPLARPLESHDEKSRHDKQMRPHGLPRGLLVSNDYKQSKRGRPPRQESVRLLSVIVRRMAASWVQTC
jgi:hypothetical protein